MRTSELITALRKLSKQGTQYRRTVCRQAADALEAALMDMKRADIDCTLCANNRENAPCDVADCDCSVCTQDCICKDCRDNSNWKWRETKT